MKKLNMAGLLKGAKTVVKKHTPEILTGIGIAGMVTTTVLAVRATPKALELLEERKNELETDKLTPVETVKTAWKPYVPAAVTGVASIACLIGASSISMRRNAILATAYKLSETALTEYKEKVVETVGEKKEKAVREKIAEKHVKENPINRSTVVMTEKGTTTCFDPISSRYFKSDIETIRRAAIALNEKMQHGVESSISVNEFYTEIGIPTTATGDSFGWNAMWLIDLDINAIMDENENPCIYVGHYNAPKYEYQ